MAFRGLGEAATPGCESQFAALEAAREGFRRRRSDGSDADALYATQSRAFLAYQACQVRSGVSQGPTPQEAIAAANRIMREREADEDLSVASARIRGFTVDMENARTASAVQASFASALAVSKEVSARLRSAGTWTSERNQALSQLVHVATVTRDASLARLKSGGVASKLPAAPKTSLSPAKAGSIKSTTGLTLKPTLKPTPGGGPLDTEARDQAILDLAAGRGVDLSMGPGGKVSRDYNAGGMSGGTVAALVLAGAGAVGLLALALRRPKS